MCQNGVPAAAGTPFSLLRWVAKMTPLGVHFGVILGPSSPLYPFGGAGVLKKRLQKGGSKNSSKKVTQWCARLCGNFKPEGGGSLTMIQRSALPEQRIHYGHSTGALGARWRIYTYIHIACICVCIFIHIPPSPTPERIYAYGQYDNMKTL